MKKHIFMAARLAAVVIFASCFQLMASRAFGELLSDENWDTFELMPVRIISVKGDASKFRAINWMDDGSTGGIKAMGFHDELGKDWKVNFEGSAIAGDNNYDAALNFLRDNGNYVKLKYDHFRKFYETYGGNFAGFPGSSISSAKLRVDPEMDIGNFFFEIGSNSNILETVPGASLSYQRLTKDGIKSSAQWGQIRVGSTDRFIAPTWEEQNLVTDIITLKGNTTVGGVNVSTEHRGQLLTGRKFREALDSTPGQLYLQEFEPQANSIISALKADKWIVADKTYVSMAYRFKHMHSDMNQFIQTVNAASGATVNDSHNRIVDGDASLDAHTWVQHFNTMLMPTLNMNVKLKEELMAATGSGFGEGYTTASNRSDAYERKATTVGESLSLRYSGLPKTALYTDWDFQQTHNWFWRTRIGTSNTEILDTGPKMTGVIGARYVPGRKVNLTTNYRYQLDRDNFDTFYNNDNGITISRYHKAAHELNTRLTWKPTKWFSNSVRVLLGNTTYHIRNLGNFTNSPDWHQSHVLSQTYGYNAVLTPWQDWLFDLAYTLNNYKVSTPASQYPADQYTGGIPTYYANYHHWLLTASYAPTKDLSLFTSGQYTWASNYRDDLLGGLPYTLDNEHYDVSLGLEWTPKEDLSIKPKYGYYSYRANKSLDYSNYSAHAAWLELSYKW